MSNSIESIVNELIIKVESSQSLIDDLRLQIRDLSAKLESQEELLVQSNKLQDRLEYFFLRNKKQLELIEANEDLHQRFLRILANLES
jgi:uncharacterized protein YllA (UPF0747 family)